MPAEASELRRKYGETYAQEAGITLRDKPAPLFQLLVLSLLFSAPISAHVATASARELFSAGWRTPRRMREESTWQQRVDALGRGGYRRYDESTARYLDHLCDRLLGDYGGDLRRLRDEAGGTRDQIERGLQRFERIGPTGAAIFCREAQGVWPSLQPYFDTRALDGAKRAGLSPDPAVLSATVTPDDLPSLAAALVRVDVS
ncbi:endonuclease [Flexivirga caeni]|uniref:Endonuclease n=1 Tax=Flexivirga caeni TaxID=2294115 RepID=A0A3M9MBH1_9MICO|nr:endonuclease [Flexivirga caeni]RNI22896.1 endonuclease [Flexivirga caeni]